MTPRRLRWIVGAVFVTGIAGMIVGSILDNNGVAITAGLFTAVAAICLMLMTAIVNQPTDDAVAFDDRIAEEIEGHIAHIVESGADEGDVRSLVREAVRLGRSGREAQKRSADTRRAASAASPSAGVSRSSGDRGAS